MRMHRKPQLGSIHVNMAASLVTQSRVNVGFDVWEDSFALWERLSPRRHSAHDVRRKTKDLQILGSISSGSGMSRCTCMGIWPTRPNAADAIMQAHHPIALALGSLHCAPQHPHHGLVYAGVIRCRARSHMLPHGKLRHPACARSRRQLGGGHTLDPCRHRNMTMLARVEASFGNGLCAPFH